MPSQNWKPRNLVAALSGHDANSLRSIREVARQLNKPSRFGDYFAQINRPQLRRDAAMFWGGWAKITAMVIGFCALLVLGSI